MNWCTDDKPEIIKENSYMQGMIMQEGSRGC